MDIYRKYFFEVEENRIHTSWMTYNFKKMASRAGLPSVVRPYDLRHTFASMNLVKWLEDGREAMDLMPYLSQFMGHSTIESTCYYIHLLPEELKRCSKIDWKRLETVEEAGISEGDKIQVKLMEIDPKTGKFKLSHRVLIEKPEGYVERERRPRPERGERRPRPERGERRPRPDFNNENEAE